MYAMKMVKLKEKVIKFVGILFITFFGNSVKGNW